MSRSALILLVLAAWPLHAATLDPLAPADSPLVLLEDHPIYTLALTGITGAVTGQRMKVMASFASPNLYPAPTVVYDGFSTTATVSFRPYQDANWFDDGGMGPDTLTVTVADDDGSAAGGADRISRTLGVWLLGVNDAPVMDQIDAAVINEDESDPGLLTFALTGIAPGPANESHQQLSFQAVSAHGLTTVEGVDYDQYTDHAQIRIRPVANACGDDLILIIVFDDARGGGQPLAMTMFWYVTILPVNDLPVLAANRTVATGAYGSLAYTDADLRLTDVDTPPASELVFQVTAAPLHGELLLSGSPLATGGRITQEQVSQGRLAYRNLDGQPDSWTFAYFDHDGEFLGPPTATANIAVAGRALPLLTAGPSAAWTEGAGPVQVAPGAVVEDGDTPLLTGWLSAVISNGAAAGDGLAILAQAGGPGEITVSGPVVGYEGRTIGSWHGIGTAADPLVVDMADGASIAAVQALARRIGFDSPSRDPGPAARTVTLRVDDGDAGTSGPAGITVSVTTVDDPPAAIAWSMATPAGVARRIELTASDPDDAGASFAIDAVTTAGGHVELVRQSGAAAICRYSPPEGFQGADHLTGTVADLDGTGSAPIDISIRVIGAVGPALLPLADPPREAHPGEVLVLSVPWDRRGITADLGFALDADAPAAVQVAATGPATAELTWTVPIDQPIGVHVRFRMVASCTGAEPAAGVLPFSVVVRPLTGGGG